MSNDKLNEVINVLPTQCKSFLNFLKVNNRSINTIINYAFDLKEWIRFQFPQFPEMDLEYVDFENITLEQLYEYTGSLKGKKADTSIARVVTTLKSFYNYLEEFNYISKSPTYKLKQPKLEKKIPKYLTDKESIKLLQSVNSNTSDYPERDYAIITVFLNTAIRLSELIAIRLDNINEDILVVKGKGNKQREKRLKSNLKENQSHSHNNSHNKVICFYLLPCKIYPGIIL
jgi:site-specific recombinase XerD